MTSFYSQEELRKLGLKSFGENVLISRNARIYGAENIVMGNHVRIDDFAVLSGHIEIGNYVHIAVDCAFFAGKAGIVFSDFTTTSSRVAVYAESDDYSGKSMTNPMVVDSCKNIVSGKVVLGKHVVVGTGSTILPGVTIGEGCSVGSMTLVNRSLEPWGIYVGIPAKRLRERSKELLKLEEKYYKTI